MGIPLGMIADRVDRRKLVAASLAIWSVMTALCGGARNFAQLMLARIGVGTGEAGGTPASQSMIADLFPFSRRVLATSIFTLGAAGGSYLGGTFGGAVAEAHGWRAAFYALGLPGIVLALLVRFTLKEPERESSPDKSDEAPPLAETLRYIWRQRSLVHVLLAATVVTYWGWGLLWWAPAFLARSHHLSIGEAGGIVGSISGVGGAFGVIIGGLSIHFLSRLDARWQVWVVGFATLIGTAASVMAFGAKDLSVARWSLWVFVPVAYLNLGPLFSLTQSLVPSRMRGLCCAILLFGANVANLALAPQIVGILSDLFATRFGAGAESLRYALLLTTATGLWAAYHLFRAARDISGDLARVGVALAGPDSPKT
jgi:MFS family permease